MNPITVGVVGAGNRGENHVRRYREIPGVEVAAVADIDEATAREVADRYGIDGVYTDYRDLLADDRIDAVNVCVHTNLHRPIAVDALEAGADVFCEKPMAGSYADAKAMADAADRTGNRLAVQNQLLYTEETVAAKRLADDGHLGDAYLGRAARSVGRSFGKDDIEPTILGSRRRGTPYVDGYGSPAFVQRAAAGGGAVLDLATYTIGQVLYLMDRPGIERVTARTHRHAPARYGALADDRYERRIDESGHDVEDTGLAFVDLDGDRTLTVHSTWGAYRSDDDSTAVLGTEGGVRLSPFEYFSTLSDMEMTATFDLTEFTFRQHHLDGTEELAERGVHEDPLYHWIRDCRGDGLDLPTADIALESMLVMDGMYLASERDRQVTREEIIDASEETAMDA